MVEIVKKSGIKKPRLVHNKILFWIIIGLGIILIFLIIFIVINSKTNNTGNNPNNNSQKECEQDSDCIPGGCCHPTTCVSVDKKSVCKGMICTEDCSGPLDCKAGHCSCVNYKCIIIKS